MKGKYLDKNSGVKTAFDFNVQNYIDILSDRVKTIESAIKARAIKDLGNDYPKAASFEQILEVCDKNMKDN